MNHFIKHLLILTLAVFTTANVFSFNEDSISFYRQEIKSTKNSTVKAKSIFLLAQQFDNLNKADSAFFYYTKALKLNKDLNSDSETASCNRAIFTLLVAQNQLNIDPISYLDAYYNYVKSTDDQQQLLQVKLDYASYYFNPKEHKKAKTYYLDALTDAKSLQDSFTMAKINTNLGLLHSGFFSQDSAKVYYKRAISLYKQEHSDQLFSTYINYANAFEKEKNFVEAIKHLEQAKKFKLTKHEKMYHKILYGKLSNCYEQLEDYKSALNYYDKYINIKDSLNIEAQNVEISKVKEQFDNEKLRADNLESEAKRIQNRNLLFGSLGVILFGSITFFLIQKNTRKKQRLAEQEKQLESQKLATTLKEQELTAIDAMIEGQEKERQRIANDLHDDLGGLMATVKLHFNALKDKSTPELFDKTNSLIDEAYQKVRTVAHAKSSGVIAKQGLLKAVQHMADKISVANKIQIDVLDHGLDQRLENSLELTLFRVIQELVTNVLKHANASEVTIHLTNHEDSINIMVEDNGKGFNPSQITKSNTGMGINSIDKRIEHLDGKLTIESEINQGTTVIVDIPI
ncbi:MAG: sensor histidine kinase [Winogradskyella sp.]|uniref:tetratricopeptide repeat-containing sensor histidine kinase n=1 Tax=Winogradskyella sp. TaxID=1883156 RepID=UPI0025D421D1|nr:sensor histidine kinase [Winogradskyella sp.]NRB58498.1 sensor histidine kinase [Winogradskyella sp.]